MLRKLLGLEPKRTEDGGFSPSPLSLWFGRPQVTDYDETEYPNAYRGGKLKILMVCTEQGNLPTASGKEFSTGNHPVEMMVPMLHLRRAGFDIDVFTPTGKPVKIEMWAMPEKDENVRAIFDEFRERFERPKDLSEFVHRSMSDSDEYIAVFFPGGHGALLGLPFDENVGRLIDWSVANDIFMLSLCHGPAALLAADPQNQRGKKFVFNGYKITAFPDAVDRKLPVIGYLPGKLTWQFGERLENLGVSIINKKADRSCHADRKLITGASPQAANNFGKLAASKILEFLS